MIGNAAAFADELIETVLVDGAAPLSAGVSVVICPWRRSPGPRGTGFVSLHLQIQEQDATKFPAGG
jgi:hypothetical protein